MLKNIVRKPINVKLEIHEEHLNSFEIIPYHKSLFGYTPSFEYYTIHLTNSRVIIEPAINKNTLNNVNDIIVGTATLVSHHAHHAHHMQHKWNHAKEKMAMLKYTFISIPYKEIQSFKNVKGAFNVNLVGMTIKPESKILKLEIFKELEIEVFKPFQVPVRDSNPIETWKHLSEKGWGNIFSESIQNLKESGRLSEEFIDTANRLLLT